MSKMTRRSVVHSLVTLMLMSKRPKSQPVKITARTAAAISSHNHQVFIKQVVDSATETNTLTSVLSGTVLEPVGADGMDVMDVWILQQKGWVEPARNNS